MKAIETKYLPCTNHKSSRIRATAEGGNSFTESYDHELNPDENHARAAIALAKKLGWAGEFVRGHTARGCVFVFAHDDRITIA